MLKLNL